jgi:hypothetical protein
MSDQDNKKPVVNCYDGSGSCIFSAIPRDGTSAEQANELGSRIVENTPAVHDFLVADKSEGPVVKY